MYRVESTTDERHTIPTTPANDPSPMARTISEALGRTRDTPIPYGQFAGMFLPGLLKAYEDSFTQTGSPSLYEKITPILYWRPALEGRGDVETTMFQGRKKHTEVNKLCTCTYGEGDE